MSLGRRVGLAVLMVVFVTTAMVAVDGFRSWKKYRRMDADALVSEPLRLAVDLSRTGLYRGTLDQQFHHVCRQQFRLDFEDAPATEARWNSLLEGLKATLRISTTGGSEVFSDAINDDTLIPVLKAAGTILWAAGVRRGPLPKGDYQVVLDVESPAPRLTGKGQFLVSRYELCGIETMRTGLMGVVGAVSGAISIISAVIGFQVFKRARTRPV